MKYTAKWETKVWPILFWNSHIKYKGIILNIFCKVIFSHRALLFLNISDFQIMQSRDLVSLHLTFIVLHCHERPRSLENWSTMTIANPCDKFLAKQMKSIMWDNFSISLYEPTAMSLSEVLKIAKEPKIWSTHGWLSW